MDEQNFNNQNPQPASNGISIAALVCGIIGIIGGWFPVICYFSLVAAILGIVFGVKGMKNAKATGQGKGLAVAGLVLGIVGTACAVIGIICVACAASVIASGIQGLGGLEGLEGLATLG